MTRKENECQAMRSVRRGLQCAFIGDLRTVGAST